MAQETFSPQRLGSTMMSVEASAQYLGAGAILMEDYDAEIHDWIDRSTKVWNKFTPVKAKGHPFKYTEAKALPGAPKMTNPRALSYNTQVAPVRQDKFGYVKACVDSLDFGMFDIEMTEQQGHFPELDGKDLQDMVTNMMIYLDEQLIIGTCASVQEAPTDDPDYSGLTQQLAELTPIAAGANIVDGVTTACANWMVSNKRWLQRPNAIWMHPLTVNKMNQQERELERHVDKLEIVPGTVVSAINTVFGLLPIFSLVLCPEADLAGTNDAYEAYIVTESMLELRYVKSPAPRVFQLGLVNDMATKHTVVLFAAPLAVDARRPDDPSKPLQHAKILISKS